MVIVRLPAEYAMVLVCSTCRVRLACSSATSSAIRQAGSVYRRRRYCIQQIGYCGYELRWRKWFGEKNAVRNAVDRPLVGGSTGHVDDWEIRVQLSRLFGDRPTVHSAKQIDVRYQDAIREFPALQQGHGFFAGCCQSRFVAPFTKCFVKNHLNGGVIFDDEDQNSFHQFSPPPKDITRGGLGLVPPLMYKSILLAHAQKVTRRLDDLNSFPSASGKNGNGLTGEWDGNSKGKRTSGEVQTRR